MKLSHKLSLKTKLESNTFLLIIWCFIASFGAYFSMYAFRKPFNAAQYSDLGSFGISLKTILILSQVFGYMLSKFIGIKVISELAPGKRIKLIITLIVIAELALLAFGIVPKDFKFVTLFINGVPLGLVWGIVFSFLEGRRTTELIATGLSISAIVSSGVLKSLGRTLITNYNISDFWMPAIIGLFFLPLFLFFVWMLSQIPKPNSSDIHLKTKRVPMNKKARFKTFQNYSIGIIGLVLTYALFSLFRDFRDNFAIEIWNDLDPTMDSSIFTWTELPIALIVIITTGMLVLFKSNLKGFMFTIGIVIVGLAIIGSSTLLFVNKSLEPAYWMILNGLGLYIAYIPFQIVMYERFVALFKIKGNAGYFMYLSDSTGYLGSIIILVFKEFYMPEIDWVSFFIKLAFFTTILGLILITISLLYFLNKKRKFIHNTAPVNETPAIGSFSIN